MDATECPCGSGLTAQHLYDARGIYCCKYCHKCKDEKFARYRVDVLNDPNYECDEAIEETD